MGRFETAPALRRPLRGYRILPRSFLREGQRLLAVAGFPAPLFTAACAICTRRCTPAAESLRCLASPEYPSSFRSSCSRKKLIERCRLSACPDSSSAMPAISSAAEAFCWIIWSSCRIALFIWSAPEFCSPLAADISCTSSAVFRMSGTICVQHRPRLLRDRNAAPAELRDFPGRLLAPLGELSHLRGDHGEPLSRIPGPGSFDRGVEGEQVRLPGDLLDDADLPRDLLHSTDGLDDRRSSLLRIGCALAGDLLGLQRVVRVLPDIAAHLLHAGGNFFGRSSLLGRPLAHLLRGGAHLLAARGDVLTGGLNIPDHIDQTLRHRFQGCEDACFLFPALQIHGQIAIRDPSCDLLDLRRFTAYLFHDASGQRERDCQGKKQCRDEQRNNEKKRKRYTVDGRIGDLSGRRRSCFGNHTGCFVQILKDRDLLFGQCLEVPVAPAYGRKRSGKVLPLIRYIIESFSIRRFVGDPYDLFLRGFRAVENLQGALQHSGILLELAPVGENTCFVCEIDGRVHKVDLQYPVHQFGIVGISGEGRCEIFILNLQIFPGNGQEFFRGLFHLLAILKNAADHFLNPGMDFTILSKVLLHRIRSGFQFHESDEPGAQILRICDPYFHLVQEGIRGLCMLLLEVLDIRVDLPDRLERILLEVVHDFDFGHVLLLKRPCVLLDRQHAEYGHSADHGAYQDDCTESERKLRIELHVPEHGYLLEYFERYFPCSGFSE